MPGSKTTIPSLVVTSWRTAPPVLRRFAYWMWGTGIVAVTASVIADAENRWRGLQFTSNIIAEVICSMVALPVALVVIGRLAEYQVRELDRVRLDARYDTLRAQLAVAVSVTRDHLQDVEQEVVASTNNFVRATRAENGALADPELANQAARILQAQMDAQQWMLYEHILTPLRILGTQLETLLVERDRNGDLTDETTRFAQLWIELQSTLAQQRQIMANGHDVFSARPAVTRRSENRANRLRDVAIEHLRGIDRLLELCRTLEAYTTAPDASRLPEVKQ